MDTLGKTWYCADWSREPTRPGRSALNAPSAGTTQPAGRLLAVLARVRAVRGRADACHGAADEALRTTGGLGIGTVTAHASWALGQLELGRGRPEEALAHLAAIPALAAGQAAASWR